MSNQPVSAQRVVGVERIASLPASGFGLAVADVMAGGTSADSAQRPLILIAEDHPDSRDALRTLLEVYGYRVETATDGRQAVNKAIATRPDLILMDIMMPQMDGFEATRALRAQPDFDQVPVLALTAMEGARDLVLAAGCDDYMPKPIDVKSFLERIRYWMESRRSAS